MEYEVRAVFVEERDDSGGCTSLPLGQPTPEGHRPVGFGLYRRVYQRVGRELYSELEWISDHVTVEEAEQELRRRMP